RRDRGERGGRGRRGRGRDRDRNRGRDRFEDRGEENNQQPQDGEQPVAAEGAEGQEQNERGERGDRGGRRRGRRGGRNRNRNRGERGERNERPSEFGSEVTVVDANSAPAHYYGDHERGAAEPAPAPQPFVIPLSEAQTNPIASPIISESGGEEKAKKRG